MPDAGPTDELARLTIAAAPGPIAVVRVRDGRFLLANQACMNALGFTAAEFEEGVNGGRFWTDVDSGIALRDRMLTEEHITEVDLSFDHPVRGTRHMIAAARMIDFDDERCGVVSFVDVTERRRLRRDLIESRERLEAFLERAPAIISMKALDGRMLWANTQAVETFGVQRDDWLERTTFDLFPADFAQSMTDLDQRAVASGESVHAELSVSSVTGDVRTFDFVKFPLRSPEGDIYAVGTIATDITDRLAVTEALRTSEQRFRQLAESLDEVFLLWTVRPRNVLYVSPAVERVLGVPTHGMDMLAFLEAIHPDDRLDVRMRLSANLVPGPPAVVDFRVVLPNGDVRWIRSRTALVENASDERRSTTLLDVTEQREARQQLVRARAEAEAATLAKNVFLSRMSHELRTPLNAVLGFAQLLHAETTLERPRTYVDQIIKAGGHLLGLIDEVLDISRIESGFLRMSLEPVSVAVLVREAVELIAPTASAVGVHLVTESDGEGLHVRADRQRLKQVLLNLLSNAVKYRSDDAVVRVACREMPEDRVRIVVEDNGPGIPQAALAMVFEPFERLNAASGAVEGTGLGLALALQLAELMGGSMGVDSEPGVGSTFWVELDLVAGSESREVGAAPTTAIGSPRAAKTVLLVEDNESNILLVQGIMRARPEVSLLVAKSGAEAAAVLVDVRPDLVLLDNHLPDTTGGELLTSLKADPRTATLRVVVVSADATEAQIDSILAAGAWDYLTKPVDVARMLAVIDAVDQADEPGTATDHDVGDEVVLYVEDDEMNRTFISRMFESYLPDVRLVLASNGAEALRLIASTALQLVMLDRRLPDMSGLDVLAALREQPATATIPVIVMSGDPPPADWVDVAQTIYMMKPFDVDRLVALIERHVRR